MAIIFGSGSVSAGVALGNSEAAANYTKYVPTETFTIKVGGEDCVHVKGMTYTLKNDNQTMVPLVQEWLNTGKVKRIK